MASKANNTAPADEPVDQVQPEQPEAEQAQADKPEPQQDEAQQPDTPAADADPETQAESEGGIIESAEELARKLEADIEELGIKIEAEGHAIVRMLVSLAGEKVKSPGDEHSCAPDEAVRMVRAGFAQPL